VIPDLKIFDLVLIMVDGRAIRINNLPAVSYKELQDHILNTHEGIKTMIVKEQTNGDSRTV